MNLIFLFFDGAICFFNHFCCIFFVVFTYYSSSHNH
jgi:hypothetical protein